MTVLFANYAEAVAEARGRAQADTLRRTKKETPAKKLLSRRHHPDHLVVRPAQR